MGSRARRRDARRDDQGRRGKLSEALRWHLDWGGRAQGIVEAAGDAAADLPFWRDRPHLADHLAFEMSAFHALARDRPVGFSIGPIPWTSIDRYAARYGITDCDAFARFETLIIAMDGVVLARVAELSDKDSPDGP